MSAPEVLRVERRGVVECLILDRPAFANALDSRLQRSLVEALAHAGAAAGGELRASAGARKTRGRRLRAEPKVDQRKSARGDRERLGRVRASAGGRTSQGGWMSIPGGSAVAGNGPADDAPREQIHDRGQVAPVKSPRKLRQRFMMLKCSINADTSPFMAKIPPIERSLAGSLPLNT